MSTNLSIKLREITKYSKCGNYENALELCKLLLSQFPESYEIYEARSAVFYRMGNYENAFDDLEYVIKLMPNEAAPIFRRGRWNLNLGNYDVAIVDFSEVIKMDVQYFLDAAYYHRAEAFLYSNEYEKALSDCEHVPDDFFIGPSKMTKSELMSQASRQLK